MDLSVFLLPGILATFSVAFGVVWRYGAAPAAFWWMLAYAAQGCGYLGEIVPTLLDEAISTVLVDALFVLGFFAFGQAICLFFRWPRRIAANLCLSAAICGVVAWQVLLADSLKGELLAVDLGCGTLALLPMLLNLRALPSGLVERVMLFVAGLSIANCYAVASLFAVFGDPDASFETYMASGYVAVSYTTSSFLNLVVPLVQLAAVALRSIRSHREASEIDALTGLLNRRGFDRSLSHGRPARPGAVMIGDIDLFKRVNDEFGHQVGDLVLVQFADAVRRHAGDRVVGARFGGEEFVLFAEDVGPAEAAAVAGAIAASFSRRVAEKLDLPFAVTASFGVAPCEGNAATLAADPAQADLALYDAKRSGRNKVCVQDRDHDHGHRHDLPAAGGGGRTRRAPLRVVA